MRKVTIEDISRETGLSRGTVSRALNDRPDISQKTKKLVLEACTKLSYAPSHAARALATGRHLAIAVVATDWAGTGTLATLRGVMQGADKARFAVQAIGIPADATDALRRVRGLRAERIDGVIVMSPLTEALTSELGDTLSERIVVSCWPLPGLIGDVITPDRREAGRLAARRLASRGCRKILFVSRADDDGAAAQSSAFVQTLSESGTGSAGVQREVVHSAGDLDRRLAACASADAVVTTDDTLALAAMLGVARAGRSVGREVALIGYGNTAVCGSVSPDLSSIDPNWAEIGLRATQTLMQRLERQRMDAPQTTEVAPTFVERESTRG